MSYTLAEYHTLVTTEQEELEVVGTGFVAEEDSDLEIREDYDSIGEIPPSPETRGDKKTAPSEHGPSQVKDGQTPLMHKKGPPENWNTLSLTPSSPSTLDWSALPEEEILLFGLMNHIHFPISLRVWKNIHG